MNSTFQNSNMILIVVIVLLLFGFIAMIARFYKKTTQGQALVRTGFGGIKVSFNGMMVVPVLHRLEVMDISLSTITIEREGKDGLVCKDNLRADIKVAFFVRVNELDEDVKKVAQAVGLAVLRQKMHFVYCLTPSFLKL